MNTEKRKERIAAIMEQHLGSELVVQSTSKSYQHDLIGAMNYYNANTPDAKLVSYLKHYLKQHDKEAFHAISTTKLADYYFHQAGILARLIDIGSTLSPDHILKFKNLIKTAVKMSLESKPGVVQKQVKSIQDRMDELVSLHCANIDGEVDNFVLGKETFKPRDYFLSNKIAPTLISRIVARYSSLRSELEAALDGGDVDLKEGYSNFSKGKLKAFIGFLSSIVDAGSLGRLAVAASKPISKHAKKFKVPKYTKQDMELGVTSVQPQKLIGATTIILYRTKSRQLINIKSSGATLSGQTLDNIDSCTRLTIRHPEKVFSGWKATKSTVNSTIKSLKVKHREGNPRITADTLILYAA